MPVMLLPRLWIATPIGNTCVTIVWLSQACHWAIDELKATVPIWKKEFYEGGEVWKENAECRRPAVQN